MHMRKALLFESSSAPKYMERLLEEVGFQVERPAKTAKAFDLIEKGGRSDYQLVIVDFKTPKCSGLVTHLCKMGRNIPVVIYGNSVQGKKHEKTLEVLSAQRSFDWIRTPIDATEFRFRINRASACKAIKSIETWNVPELRSNASGRLDATLVSGYFGWTLTDLSRSLGRSVQAMHKTPDAVVIQPYLEKLERTVLLARRLVSADRSGFRKWLNTPSPDLDETKPGELLLKKPDVVVQWLEDAALGHPA
jgi:CheY-like chemotaxis protein